MQLAWWQHFAKLASWHAFIYALSSGLFLPLLCTACRCILVFGQTQWTGRKEQTELSYNFLSTLPACFACCGASQALLVTTTNLSIFFLSSLDMVVTFLPELHSGLSWATSTPLDCYLKHGKRFLYLPSLLCRLTHHYLLYLPLGRTEHGLYLPCMLPNHPSRQVLALA